MWLCYLACSCYSKRNLSLVFTFPLVLLIATCSFPKIEIILKLFLHVMISVDRFDIVTPQGIGKGIKKEKILYWFGVYRMRVYQPGNQVSNSSLKRSIYTNSDSVFFWGLWQIIIELHTYHVIPLSTETRSRLIL